MATIDELIDHAAKDRAAVPDLCSELAKGKLVIIASWDSPESHTMTVQDFVRDGVTFIPLFSDLTHFREETKNSGFESRGCEIDRQLMLSILKGNERFVLNPGSKAVQLSPADFLPFRRPFEVGP